MNDVCVLKDSNALRGEWKLCRVVKVYPGSDNVVRNVKVVLPPSSLDGLREYRKGMEKSEVDRHVSNLIVVCPAEENESCHCGE